MASVVRGLAAALFIAAILSSCSGAVPTSALKVGDCVNHTNTTDADGNAIDSTVVVACAQPHAEEVFSVFNYPNATATFPGYEAIGAIEQTQCEHDFAAYVGVTWDQSAAYTINYAGPTEQDWAGGDHAIVCTLDDANGGNLTGSARGHGAMTVAERTAYEVVVGIEIHVQLKTASKMFCRCSSEVRGAAPNSNTCPVCLGLPGALPVINRRAVEHVLATGIAIGSSIPDVTRWDRKNYFYPDLPKGYQISQYDLPLCAGGTLTVDTSEGPVEVRLRRAHLEEDTARLLHQDAPGGGRLSLVDFNRSGIPLMEIVTEPCIRSAEVARRYAEELRLLLVTIGASDAAMEEGQMRVEANVSLRPVGTEALGTRAEVKNMNSFRSVERAIAFEIERQTRALDSGEKLIQETRGWDDTRGLTYTMRLKEESEDYRYFPEPDLPPLRTDAAMISAIRERMPELPAARRARYSHEYGLSATDSAVIVAAAGDYFAAAMASAPPPDPKLVAGLLSKIALREQKAQPDLLSQRPGAELAEVVRLRSSGAISSQSAEDVYLEHLRSGDSVTAIVAARGLSQISDSSALTAVIDKVIAANPAAVADVRAGKEQALKFLTGQVMKETRGQANAAVVAQLLGERVK